MERDIPCRDTPRTFLFIHFNSTYFNFIPNNSISFQIYFSFQKKIIHVVKVISKEYFRICCYYLFCLAFFFDLFFLLNNMFFPFIFFHCLLLSFFLLLLFFCFFQHIFNFFWKNKVFFFPEFVQFFFRCFLLMFLNSLWNVWIDCFFWGGCCSFGFPLYVFIEFLRFFQNL